MPSLPHQLLQHPDHPQARQAEIHLDGEPLPSEDVHDIPRPDCALYSLSDSLPYLEILLVVEPLQPLVFHHETSSPKELVEPRSTELSTRRRKASALTIVTSMSSGITVPSRDWKTRCLDVSAATAKYGKSPLGEQRATGFSFCHFFGCARGRGDFVMALEDSRADHYSPD